METAQFIRNPLIVDAVQVTMENIEQVAEWCGGTILTARNQKTKQLDSYIEVPVSRPLHPRQSKAFVTDWVLVNGKSFKVYANRAFTANFAPASPAHDFDPVMA